MLATKYLYPLICLAISLATAPHTYAQEIKLGKKVLVSKDEPNRMFFETDITASSTSSRDLIGCAMATRRMVPIARLFSFLLIVAAAGRKLSMFIRG